MTDAAPDPSARLTEPRWLPVVGGPMPIGAVLRDSATALLAPLALLFWGLFVPMPERLLLTLLALLLSGMLGLWTRRRYYRRQRLRVLGNVLEHRDGLRLRRLALTRAVVSVCAGEAGGTEALVLVLDDGQTEVAVGRRADGEELLGLPPRLGAYLELATADFEEIRAAAQRSYARA